MSERPPFDETVDHPSAGASVLQSLAANLPQVPRIHLRQPLTDGVVPSNQADSPDMPEVKSPSGSAPRLQLLGEIARGGMGAILKARDVDLGRDLAVKVLLEEHQGKTELAQRFIEEAQIAGQLQHPGIAPVYELGVFAWLDSCGADAELIALAKRCLAAEARDRPRHAGEVAEQVTAYQNAVTERLRQAELARASEEARAVEA